VTGRVRRLFQFRTVPHSASDDGLRTPFVAVVHGPLLPCFGFDPPRLRVVTSCTARVIKLTDGPLLVDASPWLGVCPGGGCGQSTLASIDVNIDESEKVQICLGGLASKFGAFRTAVCTREATSSFFDLQSMLLVEENHVGAAATSARTDSKMLYMEGERPYGRGGRNESVSHGGNR
jgi:hypothetical protein